MRLHEAGKPLFAGGVERAGRLVEEPDRPFDGEEPRDRKTPALAGRLFGDKKTSRPPRRQAKSTAFKRIAAIPSALPTGLGRDERTYECPRCEHEVVESFQFKKAS